MTSATILTFRCCTDGWLSKVPFYLCVQPAD